MRLNPGISGLENFRDPGIRESRDPGIAIPTSILDLKVVAADKLLHDVTLALTL